MYTKKTAYLFLVLAGLMFVGCGGGSSSNNGDIPPTENIPPVANAGNDLNAQVGQTITITGSGTDSDGSIVSYVWNNGTTQLATTASFGYTPTTEGTDTLTLTVTDDDGADASDTMNVAVSTTPAVNNPPIANAGNDLNVQVGQTITITGSGTDSDGSIVSYVWNYGTTQLATTASFEYTPTTEGTDTLTLTVTDDDGADASDSMDVTIISEDSDLTLDDFEDAVPYNPSFTSDHFRGSQNCAQCHNSQTDSKGDVSIGNAWESTMMANAAIDPLYLAKVASEVKRNPGFKKDIEEKCSRCHMPMAHVQAGFAGDTIAMSGDDGFLNPDNPYYDMAKEGVSCTLCHQIENDPKLGTEEGFSGEFVIDENTPKPDRKMYGPYNNLQQVQRMKNQAGFTPTYSTHIEDSKLCASCHNLNTPVIDAQGSLTNSTFPEQAVYTEWEFSDFNATQSCQNCHMPQAEGNVIIATGVSTARPNFHQHQFIGANTYMLDIIKNNRTKLGALANTENFDTTITNTREFLKAAADVSITTHNFTSGTLDFSVLVSNHSGHKFPTSIPTRRAWLYVKVTNSADQTVFESGAMNSNNQIIGVDDTTGYEEHYETIEDDLEVQVYEAIMADTDGILTYTFMNASRYLKDNRILPKGFKSTTPANAQPYGEATDDSDFIGGSDIVDYEISDLPDGEYTISVTLKYQTASYGFMQDLYKDVNLTEVALMKVLDENAKIHVEEISTDTVAITLP